ncbi:hypothetical protein [Castellaniella defragrans]|uniref:hypothetical protein n=1 Tax=Castellaniella defragrans TaxID=75697 RepID=UPI002B002F79|nr:hypothetical protein [Castellaniella defragrans]
MYDSCAVALADVDAMVVGVALAVTQFVQHFDAGRCHYLAQLARVLRERFAIVPVSVGALPVAGTEMAVEHILQRAPLLVEDVVQGGADVGCSHGVSFLSVDRTATVGKPGRRGYGINVI